MQHEEADLIAKALAGDADAYGELVERYKKAIYYHCFAMLRDEDAAEDIAQETFISAYYSLKQYKQQYKLSTWLFRISTNKCLNYLKRQGRTLPSDEKLIAAIASNQPSPDAEALNTELRGAVLALKPKYQAAISLYYWQGLDYAAVAAAMDAPVNSVRVWLKRAKEALRKELA